MEFSILVKQQIGLVLLRHADIVVGKSRENAETQQGTVVILETDYPAILHQFAQLHLYRIRDILIMAYGQLIAISSLHYGGGNPLFICCVASRQQTYGTY